MIWNKYAFKGSHKKNQGQTVQRSEVIDKSGIDK